MIVNDMKEVDFTYCLACRHWTKNEAEEPCHECLNTPVNQNSHKPVKYEEDPTAKKGKRSSKYRS